MIRAFSSSKIGMRTATFLKRCAVAVWLSLVLMMSPVSAEQPSPPANLTASDLEPWLDGFMANALRVDEVQGAVVAVVKDGRVIVQKGYGFSDAARRLPVDPQNTLFRQGSISKLFVWTSVMQLVEQGKINLDADINNYLDFKIAGMNGSHITVRNLMTHRAGFEEVGKSGLFSDPKSLKPLGSFLKNYVPRRIFMPGTTAAYSNYGAALSGYIVQRVSGMPFEAYVERNIFAPLRMEHSTFRMPLPKSLQPLMSKGYDVAGGEARPFELLDDMPAGALSASTSDMTRFMIAHLGAESGPGTGLLRPETARLMHRSLVKSFPDLNGMALGFYEKNVNGREVIGHGGDLDLFHSDLSLFIDDDIGLYVSFNSKGNGTINIRQRLLEDFADRYMPRPVSTVAIAPDVAKAHLDQVTGTYIVTRRLESSFGRIINLVSEASISADDKGFLVLKSLLGPMHFVEVKPFVWQQVDGKERLAVSLKDGRPSAMSFSLIAPIIEFTPVPFLQSAAFILPALLISLAIIVIPVLAWPVGAMVRRIYAIRPERSRDRVRKTVAQRTASIALIASIGAWTVLTLNNLLGMSSEDNAQILLTQAISILGVSLAILGTIWILRHIITSKKADWTTFGTSIWIAASCFLIWFHYSFNLLKFGYNL